MRFSTKASRATLRQTSVVPCTPSSVHKREPTRQAPPSPLQCESMWATDPEVSLRVSPLLLLLQTAAETDREADALQAELDDARLARMADNARYLVEERTSAPVSPPTRHATCSGSAPRPNSMSCSSFGEAGLRQRSELGLSARRSSWCARRDAGSADPAQGRGTAARTLGSFLPRIGPAGRGRDMERRTVQSGPLLLGGSARFHVHSEVKVTRRSSISAVQVEDS